jgi:cell division protein FtsQ
MARRPIDGSGTQAGGDAESRLAARTRTVRAPAQADREIPTARIVMFSICALLVLVATMYGFHRLEQFVLRDSRFALNGPEGSWESPTLEIAGATHASRSQIESVFADDSGRSVYLLPLNDRRTSLRTASWVRDASIMRLWPNRVIVRISERSPVAFVTLGSSKFGLIDEDGAILPPVPDRFTLPVLAGVHASDSIEERRKRVHRMLRLTRDLGSAASIISQIDVSDPDNLKIMVPWEGKVLTLAMGDHAFAQRYANFVNSYSDIKRTMPGARVLDLRLEDRITAVE